MKKNKRAFKKSMKNMKAKEIRSRRNPKRNDTESADKKTENEVNKGKPSVRRKRSSKYSLLDTLFESFSIKSLVHS